MWKFLYFRLGYPCQKSTFLWILCCLCHHWCTWNMHAQGWCKIQWSGSEWTAAHWLWIQWRVIIKKYVILNWSWASQLNDTTINLFPEPSMDVMVLMLHPMVSFLLTHSRVRVLMKLTIPILTLSPSWNAHLDWKLTTVELMLAKLCLITTVLKIKLRPWLPPMEVLL